MEVQFFSSQQRAEQIDLVISRRRIAVVQRGRKRSGDMPCLVFDIVLFLTVEHLKLCGLIVSDTA